MTELMAVFIMVYMLANIFALTGFMFVVVEEVEDDGFMLKHLLMAIVFLPATILALLIMLIAIVCESVYNFYYSRKLVKLRKMLNKKLF